MMIPVTLTEKKGSLIITEELREEEKKRKQMRKTWEEKYRLCQLSAPVTDRRSARCWLQQINIYYTDVYHTSLMFHSMSKL